MERVVFEFKKGLDPIKQKELTKMIESSFDNRIGTIRNQSKESNKLEFLSKTNKEYSCLLFGNSNLRKRYSQLLKYIDGWKFLYFDHPENDSDEILEIKNYEMKKGY